MTDAELYTEIRTIIQNPGLFNKSENFNIGFFSKPFLIEKGLLQGKILKTYHPTKDSKVSTEVKELHDQYVLDLREAGILVPETQLEIVSIDEKFHLSIIQEAFTPKELVRDVMKVCNVDDYLDLAEGVIREAITFSNYMQTYQGNLGFHPTLRNYAFRLGKFYYFDTFPPMSGITERELQELIVDFAPYKFPSFIRQLSLPYMNRVTNEYYQYDLMIAGIIGSSCRLRPEFADRVLVRARSILENTEIQENVKNGVLEIIRKPPKLSPLWTSLRKLLGKEGNPNIE